MVYLKRSAIPKYQKYVQIRKMPTSFSILNTAVRQILLLVLLPTASFYKDKEGLIVSIFTENTLTCNIRTFKHFQSKLN